MSELSDFLNKTIEDRGWYKRELARRAGLSSGQVTDVLNDRTNPGCDFCISVARALHVPPEDLLRMAGILPSLPPAVASEREATTLYRRLPEQIRDVILATMRNLLGLTPRPAAYAVNESGQAYDQPQTASERLAYQIAQGMEDMPPEDQQELLDFMERLQRRGAGERHNAPMETTP